MKKLDKNQRQEIITQALNEIQFAREYKQGKTKNWRTNENLYYGNKKTVAGEARANVDLGLMASFIHTILSKIDEPLVFKFNKRKDSQLQRVAQINRLREIDSEADNWAIKDIVGKKQALLYGRAIYTYYADSVDGYKPHLENVDVYDFLIDPSCGGIDIEEADYMGRYGVVKYRKDLEQGVKDKKYLKDETKELLRGSGNSTEETQEELNKQNRTNNQNTWKQNKEISNPDKFVFWEWFTTYQGERYYLLLQEGGATAIVIEPLKEKFESDLFPFWSWAAFPDLTEFWSVSYADYVRETFMAQAVSINQLLDNAEQRNKPQKLVNVSAFENLSELKYRRSGIIRTKGTFDVRQVLQTIDTPAISTPIDVYKILDQIQEKSSGVTGGAKGVADEDKVGIYEGNQANAADRFGLLNKSYSFGYKRFATLWLCGVREHLIKKVSIDLLGPNGVEIFDITRRTLFRKNDDFSLLVESNNTEESMSNVKKRTKLQFLGSQAQNPTQNPRKAYEIQASIAGFDEETIRQLMDVSDYGDAVVMSEAERDIEMILDNEDIKPNQIANTAYKQRFVDYMQNNQEKITDEQFMRLESYVTSLDDVIMRNMTRQANDMLMKQKMEQLKQPPMPEEQLPTPKAPGGVGLGDMGNVTNEPNLSL